MNEFFDSILNRLGQSFDPEIIGTTMAVVVANLIVAILIFAAFYVLWKLLDWISRPVIRRARLDETTASFVQTILKYTILAFGLIQALDAVGIDTAAVIASLGIAGLTIGFAARDALSNIISGLFIFWDRPFVLGDLIEVEGNYGKVDKITLRSTRVVTVDGKMLAIPNSTMVNTTVASYTNFPNLRLDVEVTIGVAEDVDRVREILLGLVRGNPDYLAEPPPQVVVTQLNDYNVALEVRAWLKDERQHIPKRFALREAIFETLTAAGVDMPFETLQLTPLEIRQQGDGASIAPPEAVVVDAPEAEGPDAEPAAPEDRPESPASPTD